MLRLPAASAQPAFLTAVLPAPLRTRPGLAIGLVPARAEGRASIRMEGPRCQVLAVRADISSPARLLSSAVHRRSSRCHRKFSFHSASRLLFSNSLEPLSKPSGCQESFCDLCRWIWPSHTVARSLRAVPRDLQRSVAAADLLPQ